MPTSPGKIEEVKLLRQHRRLSSVLLLLRLAMHFFSHLKMARPRLCIPVVRHLQG